MFNNIPTEDLERYLKYIETQIERYNLVLIYYEELKKEMERRNESNRMETYKRF